MKWENKTVGPVRLLLFKKGNCFWPGVVVDDVVVRLDETLVASFARVFDDGDARQLAAHRRRAHLAVESEHLEDKHDTQ